MGHGDPHVQLNHLRYLPLCRSDLKTQGQEAWNIVEDRDVRDGLSGKLSR
jgi:hypothetical protein